MRHHTPTLLLPEAVRVSNDGGETDALLHAVCGGSLARVPSRRFPFSNSVTQTRWKVRAGCLPWSCIANVTKM